MVHGFLLLFRVKEWEGSDWAPGQETDEGIWLAHYESSVFN